ncbi:purine phosphorylase [Actinoplanes cyaneus]|uniref:Purine phosphorylase n=1 Tax=Actinoplanes cyaneus TaxID=52696 RepID=A0A919IG73_9ACTN|nr:5'-methylthioadenosine/S-adenosylhomocysteine nucleosidase [Actinoplanes cyaneus]MCW2135759.1 Nucleoside phosphorylase [Actinoplanes cyaneus]GID62878.1 purine phosphorylase [Actinoplanes cyaneus]
MNEHRWKPSPIILLTALDLEYEAVRARLTDIRRTPRVAGTRFEAGSLPGGVGDAIIVLTGMGNHSSAVIAERAISTFEPAAILLVGVAGRLKASLDLGDIVVATHVYGYHGAAARAGGLKSRPRVWDIDHGIEQAAHQLRRQYDRERAARPAADSPQVHFGPIASGEVLHDAPASDPLSWIKEHYEDAIAIEMEAAGFAKAGQLNAVPGAVIRAISDAADGTKAQTDGDYWQDRAIRTAAAFAVTLAADLAVDHASETAAAITDSSGIQVKTRGGSHGAVAGIIHGGVHNSHLGSAAARRAEEPGQP